MLDRSAPDLSGCLAARHPDAAWWLRILEPLPTKAPSPALCYPYCCYSRSVIFYARPHRTVRPRPYRDIGGKLHVGTGKVFVEFDHVQHALTWDDVVHFDGDNFTIQGGQVIWLRKRWWMAHWARRRGNG